MFSWAWRPSRVMNICLRGSCSSDLQRWVLYTHKPLCDRISAVTSIDTQYGRSQKSYPFNLEGLTLQIWAWRLRRVHESAKSTRHCSFAEWRDDISQPVLLKHTTRDKYLQFIPDFTLKQVYGYVRVSLVVGLLRHYRNKLDKRTRATRIAEHCEMSNKTS